MISIKRYHHVSTIDRLNHCQPLPAMIDDDRPLFAVHNANQAWQVEEDAEDVIAHVEDPEIEVEETDDAFAPVDCEGNC